MSDPLLTIRNHHAVACGDRESGKAVLRGGDVGWNTEHEVVDGRAR